MTITPAHRQAYAIEVRMQALLEARGIEKVASMRPRA
jgi:hypothetical protein